MKAFVCGHEISYSKSPLIHEYWMKRYGLKGSYSIIDINPLQICNFFSLIRQGLFIGGNFTTPYKRTAFQLVDNHGEDARITGTVNTVWLSKGKLWGDNTDSYGFSAGLDDDFPEWSQCSRAIVAGAGGAAYAVVHALKKRGIKNIGIINRTLSHAHEIASHYKGNITIYKISETKKALQGADLIINTVPRSAREDQGEKLISPEWFPAGCIVADIIYTSPETSFLQIAQKRGLKTINGTGMLLHQATLAFERWFNILPEITKELKYLLGESLQTRQTGTGTLNQC